MRKITADYIFTISSAPIKNGVVVIDKQGKIINIGLRSAYTESELEYHEGIIIPGFINTHCHLELSHMEGVADTGVGLIPFITTVVKQRDFAPEIIAKAIQTQDQLMWDAGIMAVGDICNTDHTVETKLNSAIRYYNFIEMFDFMQEILTDATIEQYSSVYEAHQQDKSYVPHAPYTVSDRLYQFISQNNQQGKTISIHNQETPDEDALFLEKKGGFIDFYKGFGFDLAEFKATGKRSIHHAIQHLDPNQKNLFVHNTLTQKEDIEAAQNWSDNCYWATCPNANLYIENSLPDYNNFIETNAKMTIGTDSLTSNWQLSILEEMKTILQYQSYLDFETVLKWATLNGAEALGYQDTLGSIEVGKTPGLLCLDIKTSTDINLQKNTSIKRIV